jgi:hypothetical protein
MRQPPEFFGEVELPLIYIAKRLKESLKIEDLLTEKGLDYLVEPDKYSGGLVFQTERVGAFFYVAPADEDLARSVLTAQGFKPYQI